MRKRKTNIVTLETVMRMTPEQLKEYVAGLSDEERKNVFKNMRFSEWYAHWIPLVRRKEIICSECKRVKEVKAQNNPDFPELDPIIGEFS